MKHTQSTAWCALGLVVVLDNLLCMVVDHKMIAKHCFSSVIKRRNMLLGHCNGIPCGHGNWEQEQ